MINVNAATKTAYLSDTTHKTITVSFPALELSFTNDDIIQESLEIIESLSEEDSIQFVGCNASQFTIILRELTEDVKGQYVTVSIVIDSTTTETVTLFNGYVESVELTGTKRQKKIKAYDIIYSWQQTDIADWYNTLDYPIDLGDFRDSLFEELGVTQEEITLPLDDFSIGRMYNPSKLCALDVVKNICQINGVFGKINRSGNFQYVIPNRGSTQQVAYYRSAKYQEYTVNPIGKVIVKYNDLEGTYGTGENKYIVQNNIFIRGFDQATLTSVAHAIYNNVTGFVYRPFEADINGLPFLECGDYVTMSVEDIESYAKRSLTFMVLNRKIKGIQFLRDAIQAEGKENQDEFVSDIGTQIDTLDEIVDEIIDDIDSLKLRFYLISNTEDIDIADEGSEKVIEVDFQAKKSTTVIFQLEALIDVDTTHENNTVDYYDEELQVTYYLNEEEIVDYHPVETWQDGKHILHLLRYFIVQDTDALMKLEVYFSSAGGSIHIDINNLKAMLYGQNLVASDDWNGWIRISENFEDIVLPTMLFGSVTDVLSINGETPTSGTRTTEGGDTRITESGDTRITEG